MNTNLLTDDFKAKPYWWDDAPRPERRDDALPDEVDVLVVGAGVVGPSFIVISP